MLQLESDILEKIAFLSSGAAERKRLSEDFLLYLNERTNIEEQYSQQLCKLSKNFNTLVERTTGKLGEMLESFQAFQMCRSEQSNELKNIIKNDIIPTFRELLRKQMNSEKQILNEAKAEAKSIDQYIDRITKSKEKYLETKAEYDFVYESKMFAQNEISSPNPLGFIQNSHYDSKLNNWTKKKTEAEGKLKSSVEEFNNYLESHFSQIEKFKQYFLKQDNERLDMMKDSVMKYFIYEISMIRNLQYDTDNITKRMESFEIRQNNYVLCEESQDTNKLKKINFEKFKKFFSPQMKKFVRKIVLKKKDINESISNTWEEVIKKWKNYAQPNFSSMMEEQESQFTTEEKSEPTLLDKVFGDIMNAGQADEESSSKLIELMREPGAREAFVSYLESYEPNVKLPVESEVFESFKDLFEKILEQFYLHNDLENAKLVAQFTRKITKTLVFPPGKQPLNKTKTLFSLLNLSKTFTNLPAWVSELKKAYEKIHSPKPAKAGLPQKLINRMELNQEQKANLLKEFRERMVFLQSFTQDRELIQEMFLTFFEETPCSEDVIEDTEIIIDGIFLPNEMDGKKGKDLKLTQKLKRRKFDKFSKEKENNSLEADLMIIDNLGKKIPGVAGLPSQRGTLSEREGKQNFIRTGSNSNLMLKELQLNGQTEF